jgi:SAM-dependent methyltransferase
MEREQYAVMARREDDHWWYAGMRRVALRVLDQALAGRSGLLVLDAGCGTGGTTARLRRYGRVVGVDLAWEALQPAQGRGLHGRLARGDVQRLPFRDASFDAATSFEVVYHLGVANDAAALAELRRVLKPAGLLLLRVPAHDWLRGAHDRLVHTRHRYAPAEVQTKLAQAGFQVEQLAWANSLLFPAAAAKRLLLERARPNHAAESASGAHVTPPPSTGRPSIEHPGVEHAPGVLPRAVPGTGPLVEAAEPRAWDDGAPQGGGAEPEDAGAEPDLWQPPPVLNATLESLVAVEGLALARGFSFPFGLSVLAVARAV